MVRPVSTGSGLQIRAAEDTPEPSGSGGKPTSADKPQPWRDGALKPRPQRLADESALMAPKAVASAQLVSVSATQVEGLAIASPGRSQAIAKMTQVKARFEALLRLNWAPDKVDKALDVALMPVIVAAENARNPDLKLTLLEGPDQIKAWLALEGNADERRRAMFNLPGFEEHSIVADVCRIGRRTSILLVEPLDPDDKEVFTTYGTAVLPAFRQQNLMPRGAVMSTIAVGTQKSTTGCRIFALSFASKLASLKAEVDQIHEQNQPGTLLKGPTFPLRMLTGTRDRRLFDGTDLIPHPFMKHAQSRGTLKNWHARQRTFPLDNPVNRKWQTLIGRQEAHLVTRFPVNRGEPEANERPQKTSPMTYSRSIEEKRVAYIDRAIEYLRQAPESVCHDLVQRLHDCGLLDHPVHELDLGSRKWGPLPDAPGVADAKPV